MYQTIASYGFIALSVLCLLIFLVGIWYGLRQTGWTAERQKRYLLLTTISLLGWMTFTAVLAKNGIFSQFETFPPPMFINLLIPIVVIIIWVRRPATKSILAGIPLYWVPAFQGFRVVVEFLLWALFVANVLPKQLTFEGYNFDVLSGILGIVLAIFLYRGISKPIRWLRLYNFLGLALLLTIVSMSILSMPTPFRQFMNDPTNEIMTTFPYVWLPALLVPLAFALHLLSLQQTKAYTL